MSHHTWNYQAALRQAGYRVTHQRELIMDVICESRERLTARQVCEAVREQHRSINDATVYRNLHFLRERGLIRITSDHLVLEGWGRDCVECGRS